MYVYYLICIVSSLKLFITQVPNVFKKKSKISDESRNKHQKQNNVHLVCRSMFRFNEQCVQKII